MFYLTEKISIIKENHFPRDSIAKLNPYSVKSSKKSVQLRKVQYG
jgi:hypothetical protein